MLVLFTTGITDVTPAQTLQKVLANRAANPLLQKPLMPKGMIGSLHGECPVTELRCISDCIQLTGTIQITLCNSQSRGGDNELSWLLLCTLPKDLCCAIVFTWRFVLFYSSEADISTCCVCLLSFTQLLVQVCASRAQCQSGCPMLKNISVNAEQMNQNWNLLAKPSWFHVACQNGVCCVCSCFVVCWRALSSLLMSCETASYRSKR